MAKDRQMRTCAFCGSEFRLYRDDRTHCSRECRLRSTERSCEVCGERFKPKNNKGVRQRTCGRTCGTKLRRRTGTAGAHDGQICRVPWKTCKRCDQQFVARGNVGYCDACDPLSPTEYYWKHERPKKLKPLKGGICRECSEPFVPERREVQGAQRTVFCSSACAKRFEDRHSRHHQRQDSGPCERFSLAEIATRDGWRCHICRKAVNQTNWSMGHLVPMSKGGKHLRVNVALAHRDCNARRGAGRLPAQLLLIG